MRWVWLLLAAGQFVSSNARTLPVRRYEANIIPVGIAQDSQGFLWLAASGGIIRFDGLHFEYLQMPAGFQPGGGNDIDVSADGSVWLATENGLLRYRDGAFSRELAGKVITALIVTPSGRLLARTNEDLYIAAEPSRRPVQWTTIRRACVNGHFQLDSRGKVWFGCGLHLCSWSDQDIREIVSGADWFSYTLPAPMNPASTAGRQLDWADIVGLPDHSVWARNGPSVFTFSGTRLTRHTLPVDTFEGVRPGFLLDRQGRLWVPGRQLQVVENGVLQPFDVNGSPLQDVTAVFQDRRGTVWFGLAGKGLAAVPDPASLRAWAEPEGISGSVLDLAIHPQLGLMAATDSGAYIFDPVKDRWQRRGAFGRKALRGVIADGTNEILSLPYAGGLWRGAREIALPAGMVPKRLRLLFRDPAGILWIASTDGLFRMQPTGRIVPVPLPSEATYASDITADSEGRLWVGYDGGVATCASDRCTSVISPRDGLLDSRIRTIAVAAGEVWVGYRAGTGFSRFVRKPGGWSVTHFNRENGFGPVDTHFLRHDHRGWIWRGSTDGVYVCDGVHTQPEDWLHLTFGEGVNTSYANIYAWVEQSDGAVWIGTKKGVVRVRPEADWFPPSLPHLAPLPSVLRAQQDLELHLSYPGQAPFASRLFRYRLLPVEDNWRFSSTGSVRYPKLAPGSYRLEVSSGAERTPAEYPLRLPRPWWWRWLIAVAALLAAGTALALARWRASRRKTKAAAEYWKAKQEFLERRPAELEETPPEDWTGRVLDNRFLLKQCMASGGFAAVYRGVDQARGGTAVAVKLLHPLRDHEQWRRRRFVEEVTALQRLRNAGIVDIHHAGEAAPDRPYLVMELVDGVTLRELMGAGKLQLDRAAKLLQQIGLALAAAHRGGILHRDLKPENIMVTAPGQPGESIKLIDFGIASLIEEQGIEHTTKLAGSPGYLAPERWVGLSSSRSDIYSLAAIAAEMLSGVALAELGFGAGDPAAFCRRILAKRPELPQPALDLLSMALAYDPECRPADAEEFVRDLSESLLGASPTRR